ncbi:MAG: acyl-CoA dehydrogenase family protein [Candidatus Binatia bacterium]
MSDFRPELNEEQQAIQEAARRFCEREIVPHARTWEEAGAVPRSVLRAMGEQGFFGGAFPRRYGGSETGFVAQSVVIEEFTRGHVGVGYVFNAQAMIIPLAIHDFGTEEQRQQWLPRLLAGEAVGCFSLTEPDTGSDAAAIRTRAERQGDHWVLNGRKMWATFGDVADVTVLFARTTEEGGHRGLGAFLVGRDVPGVTRTVIPSRVGTRCVHSVEIGLEDAVIPDANRLGEERGGFKMAMSVLDYGRITVSSRCLGIAQRCIDASVRYATERKAFGEPIGRYQMVQDGLARAVVATEGARALVRRAAYLADAGRPFAREASIGKYAAAEAAVEAAKLAMDVHGGMAFSEEFAVGDWLMAANVMRTAEGHANIQKRLIAEDALGYKEANRHSPARPRF